MSLYRLWKNDEDYGTAGEHAAQRWMEAVRIIEPEADARVEEVADDAPTFLSARRLDS